MVRNVSVLSAPARSASLDYNPRLTLACCPKVTIELVTYLRVFVKSRCSVKPVAMPEKSREQQCEDARRVAWYKWEFLRRNYEYGRDHQGLMREFGSWFRKYGTWYDDTVPAWGVGRWQFFARTIAPKNKSHLRKVANLRSFLATLAIHGIRQTLLQTELRSFCPNRLF